MIPPLQQYRLFVRKQGAGTEWQAVQGEVGQHDLLTPVDTLSPPVDALSPSPCCGAIVMEANSNITIYYIF